MSGSIGEAAFQLAFECSPIVFVNGIAKSVPGQMLPIIALTEAASFLGGILTGASTPSLDNFFAHFRPLPGATLADWQIGTYPFANQAVAANAIIAQPLTISLAMACPARGDGGYPIKTITMNALQAAVNAHNSLGGTYIVITPSNFYINLILVRLSDISSGAGHQVQTMWQWDFVAPLLTLEQTQSVQSSLMSKLSTGTAIDGDPAWSGTATTLGNQNAGQLSNVIPAGAGTPTVSPNVPGGAPT